MSEHNIFLEQDEVRDKNGLKYRKTFHFKKWLTWLIGFFILMLIATILVPDDRVQNPTNEFSFILMFAFIGVIISLDHLILGKKLLKKGVIQ
jgi:hypothetical protein